MIDDKQFKRDISKPVVLQSVIPFPKTDRVSVARTTAEYGSFKDSRKAPIHRWFAYPAGYSYKLVEENMKRYGLDSESLVADPFLGSGTTTLAASHSGVPSVGTEAHPFVSWVATTKCTVHDVESLMCFRDALLNDIPHQDGCTDGYPELIYKCFTPENLSALTKIRHAVHDMASNADFFKLALVSVLRQSSTAGTGWPYIAPTKHASKSREVDAMKAFATQCELMIRDMRDYSLNARADVIQGDSREFSRHAQDADLVVTSPPYLNNYDYADRTRFETYFLGIYSDWKDITKDVRDRLITAATTQINMGRDLEKSTMPTVEQLSKRIHVSLIGAMNKMSDMRYTKPGKKQYDYMTGCYFEDISKTLIQVHRAVKKGGHAVWVLGDSAPYGVYVPTDRIVGELAVAAGFKEYSVEVLRSRGGKWRNNPQRHHVPLRESLVRIGN